MSNSLKIVIYTHFLMKCHFQGGDYQYRPDSVTGHLSFGFESTQEKIGSFDSDTESAYSRNDTLPSSDETESSLSDDMRIHADSSESSFGSNVSPLEQASNPSSSMASTLSAQDTLLLGTSLTSLAIASESVLNPNSPPRYSPIPALRHDFDSTDSHRHAAAQPPLLSPPPLQRLASLCYESARNCDRFGAAFHKVCATADAADADEHLCAVALQLLLSNAAKHIAPLERPTDARAAAFAAVAGGCGDDDGGIGGAGEALMGDVLEWEGFWVVAAPGAFLGELRTAVAPAGPDHDDAATVATKAAAAFKAAAAARRGGMTA